jgi:hypothetical protein
MEDSIENPDVDRPNVVFEGRKPLFPAATFSEIDILSKRSTPD